MKQILIIDDDPSVRHATQLLLECEGFEVTTADSGRAGLLAARAKSFAAAIVDIYMPDMDGLQTIKELRANDPAVRIIAVSGALASGSGGTPDFLSATTKLFGIETLHKPFRPNDLLRAIRGGSVARASDIPALEDARDTPPQAEQGALS
jgi:DNA-binding response OmpR family regulator